MKLLPLKILGLLQCSQGTCGTKSQEQAPAASLAPLITDPPPHHHPRKKPPPVDGNHESSVLDLTVPRHLLMKNVPVSKQGGLLWDQEVHC